ncbi:hypothetical protein LTR67_000089 [Exophiala xenobiotica]
MKKSSVLNPSTGPSARPAFDQGYLNASDYQDVHMADAPLTINPYQMHLLPSIDYEDDTFHIKQAATYELYLQANSSQAQPVFAPVLPPPHLNNDLATTAPVQSYFNPYFQSLIPTYMLSPTLAPDTYPYSVMARKKAVPVSLTRRLELLRQQERTRRPHHRLETLPAEIRMMIYVYLFEGAELRVTHNYLTRGRCSPNNWLSPYRLITKAFTDIIRTSRFFFHEALPSLVKATTLEVWSSGQGVHPLHLLPDHFLSRIETIKVEANAFLGVDRTRLLRLKKVDVWHEVDSPGGFDDVIHIMNCENCGGMAVVAEESFAGSFYSWRWFQRQWAYLGRLEGFAVNMTVVWEIWCPVPGMARIELAFDCATNEVVRTRAFIGSQEVGTKDGDQAERDWATYSGL